MATKPKNQTQKLADILRTSKEQNEEQTIIDTVEQANINTQQEILNLRGKIKDAEVEIMKVIKAQPFSATKLYEARMLKALLERKYDGLKAIHEELF